jgi:hypothetical protein
MFKNNAIFFMLIRLVRKIAKKGLLASSRPSFRLKELDSHQKDFYKIWYLSTFRKRVTKIKVLWKSDKNNGYFTREPTYTLITLSRRILRIKRNVLDKICEGNKRKYIQQFFRKSCALWDNVVKYCRTREAKNNIIRRMTFACWITKVTHTHTHSEYVALIMVTQTRLSVTLEIHCLSRIRVHYVDENSALLTDTWKTRQRLCQSSQHLFLPEKLSNCYKPICLTKQIHATM